MSLMSNKMNSNKIHENFNRFYNNKIKYKYKL